MFNAIIIFRSPFCAICRVRLSVRIVKLVYLPADDAHPTNEAAAAMPGGQNVVDAAHQAEAAAEQQSLAQHTIECDRNAAIKVPEAGMQEPWAISSIPQVLPIEVYYRKHFANRHVLKGSCLVDSVVFPTTFGPNLKKAWFTCPCFLGMVISGNLYMKRK